MKSSDPSTPQNAGVPSRGPDMRPANDDLLALPYADRQLIVVESDEAVLMVRNSPTDRSVKTDDLLKSWSTGISPAAFVADVAVHAAIQLWKTRKRAESANLAIRLVSSSQAADLEFSAGHPLRNIVYAGDPVVPGRYFPVNDFHRTLSDSKLAEAQRLLRCLGATEFSIEWREGSDRTGGGELSVGGAAGTGKAALSRARKSKENRKVVMQLAPTAPAHIPDGLTWFASEPLWQEVAYSRLESGLQSFSIEVEYTNDFGINANLEAKIAKAGLEIGGTFSEFRSVSWVITGSFAKSLPLTAVQSSSE